MYNTDSKVTDGRKSAKLIFFHILKPHILFYSRHNHGNGLAIWPSLPDINHIKTNNCLKLAILNLIELKLLVKV